MYPWTERSGKLSLLKAPIFLATLLPGLWLAVEWQFALLGSKPVTEAIHQAGDWAIRFLLLSLAVSPLRRIANWPKLILVRRMLGLAALGYLLLHFFLYNLDQHFDLAKVASEIALRIYLTIGFVALIGMLALGSTSFDAAIRRLGPTRWNALHRLVYPIAILGLLHFAMQSKLDVTEAILMSGLFLLEMLYRLMHRLGAPTNALTLVLLGLVGGVGTALLEAGWYWASKGIDPLRILPANFDFDIAIRPGWWVLCAGICLSALNLARSWQSRGTKASPRRARTA